MYKRLGDVAQVLMGQSPSGESVSQLPIGLPLLNGPTEFSHHHPRPKQYTRDVKKAAQAGDILFCVRGSTTGRMNWADQNYAIGRGIAAIRHRFDSTLQPLVRAAIELALPELLAQATGSTFPNVSASQIEDISFPQLADNALRDCAFILGALDDKIELNRKMSATLEAIARALFKSWFVDFEPVRAKAEGRDPGLTADIAALFPDSFDETAHGQIPRGWSLVSLSEMVEINPTTSLAGIPEAPYLDMSNVPTTGYAVDTVITRTVSSGSRFKLGDTLLARITPCLENGKTAFVDFLPEGVVGWGSTEFIVMRPRDPMPKEYGYLLSRSEAFRAYAIGKMTGTSGRQRVPTDSLASYPVVQPCAAICAVFASVIQPFFRRMSAASLESRTLAALRDALLPKLISGELRVGDGERFSEAST